MTAKVYVGKIVRFTDKGIVLSVARPTAKNNSDSGSPFGGLAKFFGFDQPAPARSGKGEVLIQFSEINTIRILDPAAGPTPAGTAPVPMLAQPPAPTVPR